MKIINLKICKNMSIIMLTSLMLSACGGGVSPGSNPGPVPGPVPGPGPGAPRVFAPTISISAAASSVAYNTGTSIIWSTSSNTTSCSFFPGIVVLPGTYPTAILTKTTTYVLTCVGPGGTARASQTISVAGSAITLFASGVGGTTIVTSPHDLNLSNIDDKRVTITGTSGYIGTYTVLSVTPPTTFIIDTPLNAALTSGGAWQRAGGMLSGCSNTGDINDIALSNVPSRFIGVAPLAVFFDAVGTTATGIARPFHDLEYRWKFGDAPATTWSTGSRAGVSLRNEATGAVAAHVYETPGVYTVELTARDGNKTVTNRCAQIVVQDPNVVFEGTKTVCVGATATPAPWGAAGDCPDTANRVVQASFPEAIKLYALSGQRVLFKRGDTFTAASDAGIAATGPGIVGAYGTTGALPRIQMSGNLNDSNNARSAIQFSSLTTQNFNDWRIMDLDLNGMGGTATGGTGASGGTTQVTVLRLTYRNMRTSIGFALDPINYLNNYDIYGGKPERAIRTIDQVAVVDSTVIPGPNTVYSGYNSGNRMAFMGNYFDNGGYAGGSHITRWTYLNKAVISNNTFSSPGGDRLAIKLHAPYWNASNEDGIPNPAATQPNNSSNSPSNYSTFAAGDGYSKHIMISDNKLTDAANPYSVTLAPQNLWSDERIKDVIVERNWWVANTVSSIALYISATNISVRNNIFNLSNGSNSQTAIKVLKAGIVPTSDQINIFNNTIYTSYAVPAGQFVGIQLNPLVTNISVANNLAYAPNANGPVMIKNDCGASCLTLANNSTDLQVKGTSPGWASLPPSTPDHFKVLSGYALSSSTSVPVYSDFFRVNRTTNIMGAAAQ